LLVADIRRGYALPCWLKIECVGVHRTAVHGFLGIPEGP
jgi:hypothetical protein